jgi:hypothetical protein
MITCQGTTQARKSNEHVSISASARAHTCRPGNTGNRRREPPLAASPLAPQPDGLVLIISMAVRDHASLVTHRHHNLIDTMVISSSQRRTCATMLTLTSHYMATNAKHPRYAPTSPAGWRLTVIGRAVTSGEKRFAADLGVALGLRRPGVAVTAVTMRRSAGGPGGGRDGGVGAYGMLWEKVGFEGWA